LITLLTYSKRQAEPRRVRRPRSFSAADLPQAPAPAAEGANRRQDFLLDGIGLDVLPVLRQAIAVVDVSNALALTAFVAQDVARPLGGRCGGFFRRVRYALAWRTEPLQSIIYANHRTGTI